MAKKSFKINLTEIEGQGDFDCPKCGESISPEDETDSVYTILDTIIGDDDNLECVVIKCNTCDSKIILEGFDALSEEEVSRVQISDFLPESEKDYRSFHTISLVNQSLGQLVVEYAQKEDVKAFKRLRNLHVGDPFKGTIVIENKGRGDPSPEDFQEITKAVRRRFKGLKNRDLYIVELREGQKSLLGRASELLRSPITITHDG